MYEGCAELEELVRGVCQDAQDRVPVCLVQRDDAGAAVEGALQVAGVGVELLGAKPADEFDNGGVPYEGFLRATFGAPP